MSTPTTGNQSSLKYSDFTTILSFITSSVTAASLTGVLSAASATAVGGIAAIATVALIPITKYLQSKGD